MRRSGFADLRLHGGRAPPWLVARMERLAGAILAIVVEEFGEQEVLKRLSDPFFFQALSNVLGYDWDSSGSTTVTCGVLKSALNKGELGVRAAGGKGARSRNAPGEIEGIGSAIGLSSGEVEGLKYASRMAAKVDNAAVQDGYQIYHHTFFFDEAGKWVVVQQGMDAGTQLARRYHWLSEGVRSFVVEPHSGIVGEREHQGVLDMTSRVSEGCRKVSTELACENPERLRRSVSALKPLSRNGLGRWLGAPSDLPRYVVPRYENVNWRALEEAYRLQPTGYEELLAVRGVGPATVRALALVSELVYGAKPSWKDPVKYTYAHGGKDGVPMPVDRRLMDGSIRLLGETIKSARLGDRERLLALRRLRRFIPKSF